MGHPAIDNPTPLAVEPIFIADEDGRPVVVPVVKATYEIRDGGKLALAEEQRPVNLTGERWGAPETSSYKYEPETALTKSATDIVLIGSAQAPHAVTREIDVTLRVGPLEKTVHVVGHRVWVKRIGGGIGATDPEPFDRIPLIYENAFGGWDRSAPNPDKYGFEPRNPVGTGFRLGRGSFDEGIRLPNLEDPKRRVKSFGDTPPPAGFGFLSPDWPPRVRFAGTYDDAWKQTRMPLLPKDFDMRFFNSASPGLIADGHLRGGEAVVVRNATSKGEISFKLPSVPPPECTVALRRGRDERIATRLDTIIINTDERVLLLLWRGPSPVLAQPQDVTAITVSVSGVPIHTQ